MVEFMLDVVSRDYHCNIRRKLESWCRRPDYLVGIRSDWFKRLHNTSLESLEMELRSSSGPSRELFRNQWRLQNAKVILEMAKTVHNKDTRWPPLFMKTVKLALESVPLRMPMAEDL